jgi:hypothetical protein
MVAIKSLFANKKRVTIIAITVAILAIVAAVIVIYYMNKAEVPVTLEAGQNFIVSVHAQEVKNLYGYQFNLYYDKDKVAYKGDLKSSIDAISMIFEKDKEDYMLVGATMIGDVPGFSGRNVEVCSMEFTAKSDIDSSAFTINRVNTVDADQNYVENISGWTIKISAKTE